MEPATPEIYPYRHTPPYTTLFRSKRHRRGPARRCTGRAGPRRGHAWPLSGDPNSGDAIMALDHETLDQLLDTVRRFVRDRLRRSEEHTSELQSLMRNSYAVFCLKKKKRTTRVATQKHLKRQH